MADDCVGLLDRLEIGAAHVVGVVDGRHDRAAGRHQPPRPGPVARLDHVHHGRPRGGQAPAEDDDAADAQGARASARPTSRTTSTPTGRSGHRGMTSRRSASASAPGGCSSAARIPRGAPRQLAAVASAPDRTEALAGSAPRPPSSTATPIRWWTCRRPRHRGRDPRGPAGDLPGHGPRPAPRVVAGDHRRHRREHGIR